jgi:hypothetical protein
MKIDQLPLFIRQTFQKKASTQILKPVTPTGESSIMQTLLTFQAFLAEKYAPKTAKMYLGGDRLMEANFGLTLWGLDHSVGHFRPSGSITTGAA